MTSLSLTGFADEISPSFSTQLAALSHFGLSHLEIRGVDSVNISDLSPAQLRQVKSQLSQSGIRVSSIGSPIGKIPITDPFAPHLEKLKRTLEIQKELSAPYLRMFSFYLPKNADPQDFQAEVLDRLGAMTEEARRWDAVLLHENEKGIYGDTAPRCLRLMEALSGPHFRAVFDFANFVEVDQPTPQAYRLLKPYIEYIHIKDADENKRIVPAGRGQGHVKEILADLISGGWRGFLSLEPHLTDFAGLAALEQDPAQRGGSLDGKASWELALGALRGILADIPAAKEALA